MSGRRIKKKFKDSPSFNYELCLQPEDLAETV
jgi:hypothetical protein